MTDSELLEQVTAAGARLSRLLESGQEVWNGDIIRDSKDGVFSEGLCHKRIRWLFQRIRDLEVSIQDWKKVNDEGDGLITSLKADLSEATKQNQFYQQQIHKLEYDITVMRTELDDAEDEISFLSERSEK